MSPIPSIYLHPLFCCCWIARPDTLECEVLIDCVCLDSVNAVTFRFTQWFNERQSPLQMVDSGYICLVLCKKCSVLFSDWLTLEVWGNVSKLIYWLLNSWYGFPLWLPVFAFHWLIKWCLLLLSYILNMHLSCLPCNSYILVESLCIIQWTANRRVQ